MSKPFKTIYTSKNSAGVLRLSHVIQVEALVGLRELCAVPEAERSSRVAPFGLATSREEGGQVLVPSPSTSSTLPLVRSPQARAVASWEKVGLVVSAVTPCVFGPVAVFASHATEKVQKSGVIMRCGHDNHHHQRLTGA